MAFTEKPPILRGTEQEQISALRDYLFRMAQSLSEAAGENTPAVSVVATVQPDGRRVYTPSGKGDPSDIAAVRKNAQELRDLIIKSARDLEGRIEDGDNTVIEYVDSKTEDYRSLYVAKSEFGTFTETVQANMESTAKGVVESYDYESAIESVKGSIRLIQDYYTQVNGEIRRGIVQDPDTGDYVTGIAISQNLQFHGECGPSDGNNPGDGFTYYYLNTGQTFGLYTSTGWQFWINGYKVGWFDSEEDNGLLHVRNVQVEEALQLGGAWNLLTTGSEFELKYIGG